MFLKEKDSGFKSVSLDGPEGEERAWISSLQQGFQQLELLACRVPGAGAKLQIQRSGCFTPLDNNGR